MTQIPQWNISGDYFETCNCDYVCPCLPSAMAAKPTHGDCYFPLVFHIEQGRYGNVDLAGLNYAVIGYAPGPSMADGNISVGIIVDERATPEQQQAIVQIGSGQGGGPMAALGPLVGTFLGVETRPITIQKAGLMRSVSIPGALDEAVEGVAGANPDDVMYLDNVPHPVNSRLALAKATQSHLHAFNLNWDDSSGNNNGHFATFRWQGG